MHVRVAGLVEVHQIGAKSRLAIRPVVIDADRSTE